MAFTNYALPVALGFQLWLNHDYHDIWQRPTICMINFTNEEDLQGSEKVITGMLMAR